MMNTTLNSNLERRSRSRSDAGAPFRLRPIISHSHSQKRCHIHEHNKHIQVHSLQSPLYTEYNSYTGGDLHINTGWLSFAIRNGVVGRNGKYPILALHSMLSHRNCIDL